MGKKSTVAKKKGEQTTFEFDTSWCLPAVVLRGRGAPSTPLIATTPGSPLPLGRSMDAACCLKWP